MAGRRIESLYYEVSLRDAQLQQRAPADAQALLQIGTAANQAKVPVGALSASMLNASTAAGDVARNVGGASASFGVLQRVLGSLGLAVGLRELVAYADGWTNLRARLSLVTRSSEQLAAVQRELFTIAQDTRTKLEPTAELYARLARSTRDLGLSQQQLLTLTRTINESFVISGTAAEAQAAALLQLGQGFASGALRGEELNAVLEQAPRLAEAIAAGMGKTVGQLRALGAEGKLTASEIASALLSQSAAIEREFAQMPLTIGQAFTVLSNRIQRFVGEADQATAASRTVAGALKTVADNLGLIANAALLIGAGALARVLGPMGERVLAFVATQKAAIAATREQEAEAIKASTSLKAQTLATLELARAKEAETAATLASLRATRAAIELSRAEAIAKLQAAQAEQRRTAAVSIESLRPLGGRVVERELAARARATQNVSRATADLARLGEQQARVNRSITDTERALAAAQGGTAAATRGARAAAVAHTAALGGMSLGARAAAGAMGILRGAMAFLGGPIGAILLTISGIFAAIAHNASVAADEAERFTNSMRGLKPGEYQAIIASLESRLEVRDAALRGDRKALRDLGIDRLTAGKVRELQEEVTRLRANLAEVQAIARAEAAAAGGGGGGGGGGADADAIRKLQEKLRDLQFDATQPDALANLRKALRDLLDEARAAGMAGEQLERFRRGLEAVYQANKAVAQQDAVRELEEQLAELTPSLVDDLTLALQKLRAELERKVSSGLLSQEQADRLLTAKERLIELQRTSETVSAALRETQNGGVMGIDLALVRLGHVEEALRLELEGTENAGERKKLEEEIARIEAQRERLVDARTKSEQRSNRAAAQAANDARERTRDMAIAIRDAARGAIQLAEAFGLIDEEAANILTPIADIAGGLGPLIQLIKDFKSGAKDENGNPLATIGSLVGAALPVIGGLASLVGGLFADDPNEARRRELQRANTEAIRELTKTLGEFGLNIAGGTFARIEAAVQRVVTGGVQLPAFASDALSRRPVEEALKRLGVDMSELRDLAKELGVEFQNATPTMSELKTLAQAIAQTELTRFAETFTGQLDALRAEFEIFDITDPIEQMERLRQVLSDPKFGAPALRQALAGLDLSTPEGRAAAQQQIERLFKLLQTGGLDPADLGGLTGQEFLDMLRELEQMIDDAGEAAGPSGTGGYNIDRSITEVTGSRIAGFLATANIWAQQTAENTAIIARALAGVSAAPATIPAPPPPPQAPAAPPPGGSAAPMTPINISIGQITVPLTITPDTSPSQAMDRGTLAGRAATDEILSQIEQRRLQQRRAGGSALLNAFSDL